MKYAEIIRMKRPGEKQDLDRVTADDFPALPGLGTQPEQLGTQIITQEPQKPTQLGTQQTPRELPVNPIGYPVVETTTYPPGVAAHLLSEVPTSGTRRKYRDTRAQLNLKISLEKLFQLRDWCEETGISQREAIEQAISLLCGESGSELGRQDRVDDLGSGQGIPADQIDDRQILSIIDFYKAQTGNDWTPADQGALERLSGSVPIEVISAGIIKSLIGSAGPVDTFKYCAKVARQILENVVAEKRQAFLIDLWRRYDRNKENIWRKQRGL